MPSALETLIKILKLEREQGCKNSAVIGGLSSYSHNWEPQARAQVRRAEQHLLVDELFDLMKAYDSIEDRAERQTRVGYMMDRITGRAPVPDRYMERLPHYQELIASKPPPERPERQERPAREPREAASNPDQGGDAVTPEGDDSRRDRRRDKRDKRDRQPEARPAAEPERSKPERRDSAPPDKRRDRPRPQGGGQQRSGSRDSDSSDGDRGSHEMSYESSDTFEVTYTGEVDIPAEPRLARPPRQAARQISPEEAADIIRGLSASVTTVKGVGPQMATHLEALNIHVINDMLFYLPRRYDDYTRLTPISKLLPESVATVIATVRRAEVLTGKSSRKDFYIEVSDGSGIMPVRFFGQKWLVNQIRVGQQIVLSGRTSMFLGRVQLTNPEWEHLDAENLHTVGIVPVYGLTEGLSARGLRRLMKSTVEFWAERLPDYVPDAVLERTDLASLGWTLKNLHFPEGRDHLGHARTRYAFDQLLLLQMAILANRRDWQAVPAVALDVSDDFLEGFISTVFPYLLTGAQRRAIEDIRRDVSQPVPMNRLLQGDVGSGKTAVATTALAMAFASGHQGAIMAPTSILAEQHYRGLSRTLDAIPGERKPVIGLLTSALSSSERESIYRGLADGSIDIIIGTHALIQEGVEFKSLAVAVIDEQHRFGVEQRGRLRGKGTNPHLLVMTATPIPRTMALTIHADLDLSVMDEMPPGRTPIKTRIVYPSEMERIFSFVETQVQQGRQAFIVYPLVESSDRVTEAKAATDAYEDLSRAFHRYRVGLLHGRMKPAEKDQVMADFSNHQFDILVTTSVAEVGVDVPNASVMVIEGANRFGLAQLHQFRGRVGRGEHESYCLLVPDNTNPEALERLKALETTTDGFLLAELDWKMRGAGDLVGTQQSGRGQMMLVEMMTPQLVDTAQREARTIYAEDPYLQKPEHALLAQRVAMLYNPTSDVS
jgi:ATP-dependent DNA helicase RecG